MDTITLVAIAVAVGAGLFLAVSRGWLTGPETAAAGGLVASLLVLWQRLTARRQSGQNGQQDALDTIEEQTDQQIEEIEDEKSDEYEDLSSGDRHDLANDAQQYIDGLRTKQDQSE